jgi:thioredoxin reductase (NADPH)
MVDATYTTRSAAQWASPSSRRHGLCRLCRWLANGIAAGGQLTTTTDVENYPGFPDGIMGGELTEKFREQSKRFGTEIFTETVNSVDMSKRPFTVRSDEKEVEAQTVIVATGAVARRMVFPGSGEGKDGYWNKVQTPR